MTERGESGSFLKGQLELDQQVSPATGPVVRRGRVSWFGRPPRGIARVEVARAPGFGDLQPVPVALPADEPSPEEAAPGELLAVAYGMFVAFFFAEKLEEAGAPAEEIVVEANCAFARELPDRDLTSLDLVLRARVRDIDHAAFRRIARSARAAGLRSAGARADLPGELRTALEPPAGADGCSRLAEPSRPLSRDNANR